MFPIAHWVPACAGTSEWGGTALAFGSPEDDREVRAAITEA
jgi:hypothetical protein